MSRFTWPVALGPEPAPAELYVHPVEKPKRTRKGTDTNDKPADNGE